MEENDEVWVKVLGSGEYISEETKQGDFDITVSFSSEGNKDNER